MLTEIFRRSPGVVRSLHPTHSVAAWGADAAAMVAGHEDAKTPCGTGSPYMRLLEHDGKILFLGATYDSMTFWHAVEELIEGDMPFSPFTAEEYCAQARRADGITMECRMRLFEPKYSRARDLSILARELQAKGLWREVRTGGAPMLLVRAADVLNTAKELCARRIYCYAV
jgi:aminoglycoside 3-N-acetyltransferase